MAKEEEKSGFDLTLLPSDILEKACGKVTEQGKWYANKYLDELIKAAETEISRIEKLGIEDRCNNLKSFVKHELETRKTTQWTAAGLTTVGAVLTFTGVFTGPAILMSAAGMALGIGSSVIGGIIMKNHAFQELLAVQVEQGQEGSWNSELKRIMKRAEFDAEKIATVLGWDWRMKDEDFKKQLVEAVMLYGDKIGDGFLVYIDLEKQGLVEKKRKWVLSGAIQLGVMAAAVRMAAREVAMQPLVGAPLVRGTPAHRAQMRALLRPGLKAMANRVAGRVGARVQQRMAASGMGRGAARLGAAAARGGARAALYSVALLGPITAIGAAWLTHTENNAQFDAACDELVRKTNDLNKEMKAKLKDFTDIKKDQNKAWDKLKKHKVEVSPSFLLHESMKHQAKSG